MKRGSYPSVGAGAIGLLVAVVVLGGLAALVISVDRNGGASGRSSGAANVGTLSPAPGAAAGDISAAAQGACRSDYQAVQQAADAYSAEHGHPPSSMADLAGMLKDPVTSVHFTISLGPAGQVEVASPGHPAASGNGNCAYAR